MGAERDWRDVVRADRAYHAARARLFTQDPLPVLRTALGTVDERATALRLLDDIGAARHDLVRELLPELFSVALGLSPDSGLARRVLRRLGGKTAEPSLRPLVAAALPSPVMEREEFRGLAMLLEDLELWDLLEEVLAVAAGSDDLDIREIAADFPEGTGRG